MMPAGRSPSEPRGFVLVGVVMLVLALTIIGMSLYGLSGYEASFMQDSMDREQALHRAAGGQEVVKTLLAAPPYSLAAAKAAQGHAGIVYANAWQVRAGGPDSTGTLDWDQPVQVRVMAQSGAMRRTVEGRFLPSRQRDPYEHLIASSAWMRYDPGAAGPATSRLLSTVLNGRVWQSPPHDSAWKPLLQWPSGGPIAYLAAPTPDRPGFIASQMPLAGPPDAYLTANPSKHVLRLFAVGGGPPSAIFRTPASVSFPGFEDKVAGFDFFVRPQLDIEVRDVAVLLVPAGVFFEQKVAVRSAGGSTPTLILVAGPNGRYFFGPQDYRNVGIWFFGGLEVEDNVDVFLVSDGEVRIEHFNEPGEPSRATHLTIFAAGVHLMGPVTAAPGNPRMDLRHDPADVAFLTRIRDLQARGLLPSASGTAASTFRLVPGSWREP